jgi:hypothetical protein
MKTTIEIADDLFERTQKLAKKQRTTFRALTEDGLRLVLKRHAQKPAELPPLVTAGNGGMTEAFRHASWERVRDEIYRGHGAV